MVARTARATVPFLVLLSLAAALPAGAAGAATTAWRRLPMPMPVERDAAAMAFDPAHGEVVLFGGGNSEPPNQRNDTWTWNGLRWRLEHPSVSPSARTLAAMASDPARGEIVLFGGFDRHSTRRSELRDTWVWNGSTWTKRTPAVSPPPRYGASTAYDPVSRTVLLFGGADADGVLADTWSWNGTTWRRREPATSPPPRGYGAMATLGRRGVALFGGFDFFGGYNLGDTWTWDGSTWTHVLGGGPSPSPRSQASMAGDPTGGIVLHGGATGVFVEHGDTWSFNGEAWELVDADAAPGSRAVAAMAYDPARRRTLLFGGRRQDGASLDYLDDSWLWDGRAWDPAPIPPVPPGRAEAGMAFDRARGEVVLFGGWNHMENLGDTWIFGEGRWRRVETGVAPAARSLAGMAYDAARRETVLFGGGGTGTRFDDTWIWDGSEWSLRTVPTAPSARYGAAVAYDAARQEVVLFGGSSVGQTLADTWAWNGTAWRRLTPRTSPPARLRGSMAYDAATRSLVLFGGFTDDGTLLGDTWTWDGGNWRRRSPATSPSRRYSPALAGGDGVLLFGGATWGAELGDTWRWNGTTWIQHTGVGPTPAHSGGLVYDAPRRRFVLFGGSSIQHGALRETWIRPA